MEASANGTQSASNSLPDDFHMWLPPCIALLASLLRGLTTFGDGVAFQSLWAVASVINLIPDGLSGTLLRKSVLYSSIMQTVSMPIVLWQARKSLRTLLGYVIPVALVGGGFVFLGAHLLLTADIDGLKIFAGLLFLCFSASKLTAFALQLVAAHHSPRLAVTQSVESTSAPECETSGNVSTLTPTYESKSNTAAADISWGSARSVLDSPDPSSEPESPAGECTPRTCLPQSLTPSAQAPTLAHASTSSDAGAAAFAASRHDGDDVGVEHEGLAQPAHTSRLAHYLDVLPKLSPGYSPRAMLAMLLVASVAGGLLSGLFGTGTSCASKSIPC